MCKLIPLLLLALSLNAQEPDKWQQIWKASLAASIAANAADAATSYGLREGNPVLGERFNSRSVAIKSGMIASSTLIQIWAVKRHPKLAKPLSFLNFGTSAGLAGVAWHNMGLR